jgi:hypothetical protein
MGQKPPPVFLIKKVGVDHGKFNQEMYPFARFSSKKCYGSTLTIDQLGHPVAQLQLCSSNEYLLRDGDSSRNAQVLDGVFPSTLPLV